MDKLAESFEDVADWCEKRLEAHWGQEIGLIFGTMLRAYGRLATLPPHLHGDKRAFKENELNAHAEELLFALSARFHAAYRSKSRAVEADFIRTNMMYDAQPRPQE